MAETFLTEMRHATKAHDEIIKEADAGNTMVSLRYILVHLKEMRRIIDTMKAINLDTATGMEKTLQEKVKKFVQYSYTAGLRQKHTSY